MARYFFQAHYHGAVVVDDDGEDFATPQAAEAYATIIARELASNDPQPVTVSVLTADGALVATKAAPPRGEQVTHRPARRSAREGDKTTAGDHAER
jgi:hypothetical protein